MIPGSQAIHRSDNTPKRRQHSALSVHEIILLIQPVGTHRVPGYARYVVIPERKAAVTPIYTVSSQQSAHPHEQASTNAAFTCSSSASPLRHPCFFLETTYATTAAAEISAVTVVSTCLSCCCMTAVCSSQHPENCFSCSCCRVVARLDWHLPAVLQNKILRDAYLFPTGSSER